MIERTTYKLKGTLRIDFETDRARLDSFPALESDWNKLLHRLTKADEPLRYHDGDGEEDMLYPFLENQELTVFADITRKKLSNYGNSFANVQGTAMQAAYVQKLRQDINRWIARYQYQERFFREAHYQRKYKNRCFTSYFYAGDAYC